ncbi:Stp1/IreP family PP2C-type Ser/Thr phosphatase [Myxococcota bacterium]|nr:Stp1/IreP family PP2C-type Ser/Thr phosphatase [Myxococcota bacterium]
MQGGLAEQHLIPRPPPFPPGTQLSEHYSVEGLVRLSEGRMFYLANDDRPDRPRKFCWECGSDETPRAAASCVRCGADLSPRRFLISVRWETSGYEPFAAFFDKQLDHPGLVSPVDLFFQDGVLCSVTPWGGEGLMLDEGSPLGMAQVLELAQRATGMLAFLQSNGVRLATLTRANFLVRRDGQFLLFDPEVAQVYEGPVPEAHRSIEVAHLGAILRRYTPATAVEVHDFFLSAEEGTFASPFEFGRALEELLATEPEEPPVLTGAMSDVGLCRVLNEDNWGWVCLQPGIFLYVVADGMGGHESGEVASEMAVSTICHVARERLREARDPSDETLENVLDEAFQAANNTIKDHSIRMGNDMGTTLVAALVSQDRLALVANVGDSRAYLLRHNVLHQVTRDHSLVARMVEQNRLTPEEARNHPHSNILLRTVGTERNVDIDIFRVELEPGDQLLLNSDGLWGEVEDEDLEAVLNHYSDPRLVCRELVRAAHHGGGRDNITVLLVGTPKG